MDVKNSSCRTFSELTKHARRMLYLVTPEDVSSDDVRDVSNYIEEAIPLFLALVVAEYLIATWKGVGRLRINDALNSLSCGLFQRSMQILLTSSELAGYLFVYSKYRVLTVDVHSHWTWWLSFLGVDFLYYWFHRAAHEINIMWAFHQAHHSSEDFNLVTALRQGVLQYQWHWVFYLPLALFLPPPIFYAHTLLNVMYQFWIHTELIGSLGPLDLVLNTPSHHRVHHGRNPYCLDKNYGGTLIIWDRLFGTFQAEGEEKVVYGLVHRVQSWDILYVQFFHFRDVWHKFTELKGWKNKVSALIKGPGWTPGSPWRGNSEDVPEVEKMVLKYDKSAPVMTLCYIFLHWIIILTIFMTLVQVLKYRSLLYPIIICPMILMTIVSVGYQLEHKWYASVFEAGRCFSFLLLDGLFVMGGHELAIFPSALSTVFRGIFVLSAVTWTFLAWKESKIRVKFHES